MTMPSTDPIVLSYVQAEALLAALKRSDDTCEISPDLGISTVKVMLSNEGVSFATGEWISWAQIQKIKAADVNCFMIECTDGDNESAGEQSQTNSAGYTIRAIRYFSEET